MNIFKNRLLGIFKKIHLVDKCLIVFMAILLLQSAYNLFSIEVDSQEISSIDIVFRTATASIFGYFLSANFLAKNNLSDTSLYSKPKTTSQSPEIIKTSTIGAPKNQIGFTLKEDDTTSQLQYTPSIIYKEKTSTKDNVTSNSQIIIATVIGSFCLLILIIFREFGEVTSYNVAIISQLRDFVSGCVGFLIGCATDKIE